MHVDSLPRHDPDLLFKRVSIYFHGISAAVLRDSLDCRKLAALPFKSTRPSRTSRLRFASERRAVAWPKRTTSW